MNSLSKYLVDSILEEDGKIKDIVVVYSGRFQPFHKGHYATYTHLVKKFGKDNVFIATSDVVKKPKSPFNFNEKVKIITTMFGIPKSKIIKIKNPYKPIEILEKYNSNTTAYIAVVGEKDRNRFGGKYFKQWNGNPTEGYLDGGYVYASPSQPNAISGTEVRNGLSVGSDKQKEDFFKDRAYGKFNASIFKLISDKLNEGIIEIKKEWIEDWLISEGSISGGTGFADDGPASFARIEDFPQINAQRAQRIGYKVIDAALKNEIEGFYDYPSYPDGPVPAVSYFPAGEAGKTSSTNQIDLYTIDAYTEWFKHMTRWATLTGYKVVKNKIANYVQASVKKRAIDLANNLGDYYKDEYEIDVSSGKHFNPLELGQEVTVIPDELKIRVESFEHDTKGRPILNGKLVKRISVNKTDYLVEIADTEMRCEKCNHQWQIHVGDPHPYLCYKCGWNSVKQIYDFKEWEDMEKLTENISQSDLDGVEKYADRQLAPIDVEFSPHFFDQLKNKRNRPMISKAELIGFFKRLTRSRKNLLDFLKKYREFVATDNRSKINIPLVNRTNQIIAKTVMRKPDFKTSNAKLKFESVGNITEGITNAGIKAYYNAVAKAEGVKPLPLKFERVGKGGAATTYNARTMTPLYISFDITRMLDPEFAVLHELAHQIKLETEKDAYQGKRDQLKKFKKLENYLIDKYVYSSYSSLIFNTKKSKNESNQISGGLADKKTLTDLANKWNKSGNYDTKEYIEKFIKPQLKKGIKVEMEHTDSKTIATEIAMDHLWEDPKYYTKLATIENVSETSDSFDDFAKGRRDGAGKISNNAKEKGGDSLLTHHHFDIKLPYYEKASRGEFDLEQAKEEFNDTYKKINFDMDDIDFQKEMGRLEVLGELIIKYSSLR